jgi:hypothetical protein
VPNELKAIAPVKRSNTGGHGGCFRGSRGGFRGGHGSFNRYRPY